MSPVLWILTLTLQDPDSEAGSSENEASKVRVVFFFLRVRGFWFHFCDIWCVIYLFLSRSDLGEKKKDSKVCCTGTLQDNTHTLTQMDLGLESAQSNDTDPRSTLLLSTSGGIPSLQETVILTVVAVA